VNLFAQDLSQFRNNSSTYFWKRSRNKKIYGMTLLPLQWKPYHCKDVKEFFLVTASPLFGFAAQEKQNS
jgi:hypothetical protein